MTQQTDRDALRVESVSTEPAREARHESPQPVDSTGPEGLVVDLRSGQPLVVPGPRSSWQLACKRLIDVIGASVALIVLSPVLVVTMLLVALTSRGPVLFRQQRVGQFGEEFSFLKFRSMFVDAEARKQEFLAHNDHVEGPIFKMRNDPRVTPVGRAIRKFSIDELPQLVHVLTGKMSLVGPRPPIPAEVQEYGPRELSRLTVKPGVTCIWQVSGRSEVDFETWMDMDIEYIENWSLWLDLKLVAKTIPAVITGRGAY